MSPAFRSLLMKEWSERRHFFWCAFGLLFLNLGYCIAYEVEYRTRAFVASYYGSCLGFIWLASILLSMSVAHGEATQRTLRFSAALPISLQQVAWARLLVAWGCLVVPIVCGAVVVALLLTSGLFEQAGLRPVDYASGGAARLVDRPSLNSGDALHFVAIVGMVTVIAVVIAIHTVTLLSLIGTWCRSEEVVGLLGALTALISLSLSMMRWTLLQARFDFAANWISAIVPGNLAINWGYMEWDGSSYTDLELAPLIAGPAIANVLFTIGLGMLFAWRYGRRLDVSRPVSSTFVRCGRWLWSLLPRFGLRGPGEVGALIWLSSRQSISLCLVGLLMAVLLTCVSLSEGHTQASLVAKVTGLLPSSTWFVGILWGAVVAVSVFSSELKSDLEQFWRSRPISPARWFWVKYFTGLAALLITIDLLPSLLARSSSFQPPYGGADMASIACMPLLHALTYALTVAVLCRWRRPIPAAVTSLMLYFLLEAILQSIPVYPHLSTMNVYNRLEQTNRAGGAIDLTSEGYPIVYGAVLLLIVGATIFARRTIVPPVASRSGSALLFLALILSSSTAECAEAPDFATLEARIAERDKLLEHLHLQLSRRVERFPVTIAGPESSSQPAPKHAVELQSYHYYRDGVRRAWTEFNADKQPVNRTTYDGTVRRDLTWRPFNNSSEGMVTPSPGSPPDPFLMPESLIGTLGIPLSQLPSLLPAPTAAIREVDGEQLLDVQVNQKGVPSPESGSMDLFDQHYQMTYSLTHNDWPVLIKHETIRTKDQRLTSRQIVTCTEWIEAGAISYPKHIVHHSYFRSTTTPENSDELALLATQEILVEVAEVDPVIPDGTFMESFPAGTRYYDMRDRKYYDVDASGATHVAVPKPKGWQGAVLTYHLIWIIGAIIYCVVDSRRRLQVA